MKLEINHLVPYLPYNPKVLNGYGDISDLKTEFIRYPKLYLNSNKIDNIALILRPLSDLTKEIEHNGEKFVPLYRLIKEDKAFTNDFINVFGYEELKVSVYELLLEWHFDVFGLIEKNLAININTL